MEAARVQSNANHCLLSTVPTYISIAIGSKELLKHPPLPSEKQHSSIYGTFYVKMLERNIIGT